MDFQNNKKAELEAKLEELKIKKIEEETQKKAAILNLPYINLKGRSIPPEILRIIPEEEAKKVGAIPFSRDERKINLAVLDPTNPQVLELKEKIELETNLKVFLFLTSALSFTSALKLYGSLPKLKRREKAVEISEEEILAYQKRIKNFRDLGSELRRVSASDLITLTIATAIKSRASDIHIEAEEKEIKFRFRIDGILHEAATLSKNFWPSIISRIKLLASLKINVTDQPQEGHFSIFFGQEKIDVRVSTIPTAFGESVVIRLLMPYYQISLENLGFRKRYLKIIKKEVSRPNGMIITTGPTGAGKTTTLYAILNYLNKPEIKIITLEEPIEYELKGVIQTAVDTSKGQSFAKNLRAIMRQDPDIIMVGEIRDQETAEISIQAALTGHLVFSTLHTNDAAGAIPRFLVLGVKPYLLAPALNMVIAQRLVRRICENCREETKIPDDLLEKVKKILDDLPKEEKKEIDLDNLKFYRGRGCEVCQGIGYKGRIGIFEFFTVNDEIEKLILKSEISEYEMRKILKQQKMVTMVQDGLLKALRGITTVEEVFRVIG
ncbi:MAG: GspE/PulE family protein [Patescibacteria group bacterium]